MAGVALPRPWFPLPPSKQPARGCPHARHPSLQLRAGNVLGDALEGEEPFDAIHVGAGARVRTGGRGEGSIHCQCLQSTIAVKLSTTWLVYSVSMSRCHLMRFNSLGPSQPTSAAAELPQVLVDKLRPGGRMGGCGRLFIILGGDSRHVTASRRSGKSASAQASAASRAWHRLRTVHSQHATCAATPEPALHACAALAHCTVIPVGGSWDLQVTMLGGGGYRARSAAALPRRAPPPAPPLALAHAAHRFCRPSTRTRPPGASRSTVSQLH